MASSLMAEGRFHHHGFASVTKIKLRKSTFPAGTFGIDKSGCSDSR